MKKAFSLFFVLLVSCQTFSQLKLKVGDKAPIINITDYLQNTER